jgi:hypothetical protein
MNRKVFNSLIMAVCGILFCLMLGDVNGKWIGYADYNGNDIPLTYTFKTEGNKLTGTSQTPLGTAEITDGKIEKDVITFKTSVNGEAVTHSGKVFTDSITLTMTFQGNQFAATLKRAK